MRTWSALLFRNNFVRCALVVASIGVGFGAYQNVQVRRQCGELTELRAETLTKEVTSAPVWARVSGFVPAFQPVLVARETGQSRGALLPLASPTDRNKVIAFLKTRSLGEARAVQRDTDTLTIEGVYALPDLSTRQLLDDIIYGANLSAHGKTRVVELGSRPVGLSAVTIQIMIAAALGFSALLAFRLPPLPVSTATQTNDIGVYECYDEEDEEEILDLGMPAEVTVQTFEDEDDRRESEISRMLDDVWRSAEENVA